MTPTARGAGPPAPACTATRVEGRDQAIWHTGRVQGPSRPRVWLAGIFVLALVIRFMVLAVEPTPTTFAGLSSADGEVARNIVVHGRWDFVINDTSPRPKIRRTNPDALVDIADFDWTRSDRHPRYEHVISLTPGVAVLLAGLWKVTGDYRYDDLQAIQMIIDAGMVFLIYWI